ncbi:D-3-phosphoglycerate dehydrogenase [Frankliniella fusca]|uniref:D-3-phosphoglycerate dehydrogenase n=1 Tax=Frankliniella fusca TaxID=407009 RepID=A0AAE1LBG3_9NEOP|nr:D-3-phosphoglycerate dehydrogenase [Frankliniella fusca]
MAIPLRSVLVSDEVDPLCVELLQKHGIPVTCKYKMPKEELLKEIAKHDGLVVRSDTKVTAEVIAAATNLRVVGRAGTGVDNIDLEAATARGIIVLNTPGGNSISACELTCALIADLARNVSVACQSLKAGRWDRKLYSGTELQGKTLAVLGLGRIGREVATRMQAYGMKIIGIDRVNCKSPLSRSFQTVGFDPIVTREDAAAFNVEKMELEQIWPVADYITVHTPLIPQTRNMINDQVFTKCKRGVKVVNVARGGIICEEGLLKALQDGRCGGAALDVFSEEPPKGATTRALIEHPKVVATPHLGASTAEAQSRVAVEVAEQFVALADPSSPYSVTGVVNAPVLSAALVPENAPWIALAQRLGVLAARVLAAGGKVAGAQVAVQTAGAALQRKAFLVTPVAAGLVQKPGVNLVNAPAIAKQAGLVLAASHDDRPVQTACLRVSVNGVVLTGTVGAAGASVLLAVGDASFGDAGVPLDGNLLLVHSTDATLSVANTAAAASKVSNILGLSVGVGSSGVWTLLRTAEPAAISVPGAQVF